MGNDKLKKENISQQSFQIFFTHLVYDNKIKTLAKKSKNGTWWGLRGSEVGSSVGLLVGLIVGEKISKAFNYASRNKLPVVSMISSGGKRVQEGLFSLIQMIKTTISTKELENKERYRRVMSYNNNNVSIHFK